MAAMLVGACKSDQIVPALPRREKYVPRSKWMTTVSPAKFSEAVTGKFATIISSRSNMRAGHRIGGEALIVPQVIRQIIRRVLPGYNPLVGARLHVVNVVTSRPPITES